MLEFQEKRKFRRFLYSRITLIILFLMIILAVNSVLKVYKKQNLAQDNLIKTASVYNDLQAREKTLTTEIERLKTPAGVEEEIRERYGLVKPGEEVIVIADGEKSAEPVTGSVSSRFWQKILDWFQ